MKMGCITLEEEEAAKRERYPQVLSVEKLRFADEPQAGTRCGDQKKGYLPQMGRGQVLQARHYVYYTKRPRDILPCRQTGPDVSCWELVRFTSGDKNRLSGLAFSFNRGVKRPARLRPRYWTFRDHLRAESLRAEIHCTMRVVTLVCHLVNLFFIVCSPQLGCRWSFTVRKDGRSGARKRKFLWLFLRPFFVNKTAR